MDRSSESVPQSNTRPLSDTLSQADTVVGSINLSPIARSRGDPTTKKTSPPSRHGTPAVPIPPQQITAPQFDNSSPTKQQYSPTNTLRASLRSGKKSARRSIRRPSESFFESDTTESDEAETPVVGRATSVRIDSPRVVQHRPSHKGREIRIYDPDAPVSGLLTQSLNYVLEQPNNEIDTPSSVKGTASDDAPRIGAGAAASLSMRPRVTDVRSPAVPEPHPKSTRASSMKRKLGGLDSNPMTDSDRHMLSQIGSTLTPKKELPRVKIRLSDLAIPHKRDSHFRESIVSTPYPAADVDSESASDEDREPGILPTPLSTVPLGRAVVRITEDKADRDRFPSPDRSEILLVDICLARHHAMSTTVEIHIKDKSMYDDEMLFQRIRSAYHQQLLRWTRLPFCVLRAISHVTLDTSLTDSRVGVEFREADFLRHFFKPRVGRKRKTWVVWLRNHNRHCSSLRVHSAAHEQETNSCHTPKRPLTVGSAVAERRASAPPSPNSSQSSFNLGFLPRLFASGLRLLPFRHCSVSKEENKFNKQTTSHVSKTEPPLETKAPAICESDTSRRQQHNISICKEEPGLAAPCVRLELHHTFNFWTSAFWFICTVLMSVTATVLWIIFGVPGGARLGSWSSSSSSAIARPELNGDSLMWRQTTGVRVLTGLVLGLVLLTLGVLCEICMLAGAWILL